jgi:hypothetical protein
LVSRYCRGAEQIFQRRINSQLRAAAAFRFVQISALCHTRRPTMARRRKSKRLLQLEDQFKATVNSYLATLGARPGRFYQLELDTPAGSLHVSVYGDWIACRFDHVELGKHFTRFCGPACNPYSGKWNFIYGITGPFDPDQSLADFRRNLERLMGWQAAAA